MEDLVFIDREMNKVEQEIYLLALEYLDKAQELFGPQIEGIDFRSVYIHNKPAIIYLEKDFSVAITLSPRYEESDVQLVYQLTHEVCHLLHPTIDPITKVKDNAIVLNEGLSTYFSILMTSEYCDSEILIEATKQHSPNYYEAYLNVKTLLEIDIDLIKKLRAIEPKIDRLTPAYFTQVNTLIPQYLIEQAVSFFKY